MKATYTPKPVSKTEKGIALILTCLFIPLIFGFGISGLVSDPEQIVESLKYSSAAKYLNGSATDFFAMTQARIASLENRLGLEIPYKTEMGYLNAAFQMKLNKKMIMAGSRKLVRLEGGQLYNMSTITGLKERAEEVVAFRDQLPEDMPFLFAYISPQFYEGSIQLPEGFEALDDDAELNDEIMSIVRENGIEALSSCEFMKDTGYTDNELFYRGDMHWTNLGALCASRVYAAKIEEMTGVPLAKECLNIENFDTREYPEYFLGEYGRQLGPDNAGLEDIILYVPKYPTDFTHHVIQQEGTVTDAAGDFWTALVEEKRMLVLDEGHDYSIYAYGAYGLLEQREEIHNNDPEAADLKLLIYKDSFTAPIVRFLSLLVKDVVAVDMRYQSATALEIYEEVQPDMVIMSHSRNMYEQNKFTLGTDQ